jgi:hypothetical protein
MVVIKTNMKNIQVLTKIMIKIIKKEVKAQIYKQIKIIKEDLNNKM